jgi:polyphosphate kinase
LRLRSLVDRFLEHARIYRFHHGGADLVYVGSADWMTRNLDRRVEVVFPLLDPAVANRVREVLALQLADTERARIIDAEQSNRRVPRGDPPVRAQLELYESEREKEREREGEKEQQPSSRA